MHTNSGGAAGNEGLGMFSLCLDWNYVGSGGGSMGALFTPLSTQLSLYFGTMICMLVSLLLSLLFIVTHLTLQYCILCMLRQQRLEWPEFPIPFTIIVLRERQPFWPTGYSRFTFPLGSSQVGRSCTYLFSFSKQKYTEAFLLAQGLPWFASSQVLTKIGSNLAIGATVMHVILWYGKDIIEVIRKYRVSESSSQKSRLPLIKSGYAGRRELRPTSRKNEGLPRSAHVVVHRRLCCQLRNGHGDDLYWTL